MSQVTGIFTSISQNLTLALKYILTSSKGSTHYKFQKESLEFSWSHIKFLKLQEPIIFLQTEGFHLGILHFYPLRDIVLTLLKQLSAAFYGFFIQALYQISHQGELQQFSICTTHTGSIFPSISEQSQVYTQKITEFPVFILDMFYTLISLVHFFFFVTSLILHALLMIDFLSSLTP